MPPADVGLAALGLQALGLALLQLELVGASLQHLDRLGAEVLAAFLLHGDGDAGGKKWVMRAAESVLLTGWPSEPEAR